MQHEERPGGAAFFASFAGPRGACRAPALRCFMVDAAPIQNAVASAATAIEPTAALAHSAARSVTVRHERQGWLHCRPRRGAVAVEAAFGTGTRTDRGSGGERWSTRSLFFRR